MNSDRFITPKKTAEILQVKDRTLEQWRLYGKGPPYIRVSRRCIRYDEQAVRQWMEARSVIPGQQAA